MDFEAAHAWRYCLEALLLGNEIELLNTLLKDFSVNFTRHVGSILGSLKLQLFLDGLTVELAFTLTPISTDPLEAVVGEELCHFFALLLIVVPFNGELGNMVNAIIAGRHREFSILIL